MSPFCIVFFGLCILLEAKPIQEEDVNNFLDEEDTCTITEEENFIDEEIGPLNAIRDTKRKWPRGRLYYKIDSSYSSSQRREIVSAAQDLEARMKYKGRTCIRVRERDGESDYVKIEQRDGCNAQAGYKPGRREMSLASSCVKRGTIQHEFLHSFGFHHEHQRSDRDTYIEVKLSNVRDGFAFAFERKRSADVTRLGTNYDYSSILHYKATAFAKDKNKPTIVAKKSGGSAMGTRVLSRKDIEMVQVHYGCKNARDSVYFQHLADDPEFNMAEDF